MILKQFSVPEVVSSLYYILNKIYFTFKNSSDFLNNEGESEFATEVYKPHFKAREAFLVNWICVDANFFICFFCFVGFRV